MGMPSVLIYIFTLALNTNYTTSNILVANLFTENGIVTHKTPSVYPSIHVPGTLSSWFWIQCKNRHHYKNLVIKDGDTITSSQNVFRLGFFSPDNITKNRYLGIYYTFSKSVVVWVANRGRPIPDSSGRVKISRDGNIVLKNRKGKLFWSSNIATSLVNASAQLMDTGNLILRENSSGNSIWESFLHPCDIFLPTAKVIHNINTGYKVVISSWKSPTDPDFGSYTCGLDALGIPQMFIWNWSHPHWRSGPWNGEIFMGVPEEYAGAVCVDKYTFVNDSTGISSFIVPKPTGNLFVKSNLNSTGSFFTSWWNAKAQLWEIAWLALKNECDVYGTCGPFGSCNAKSSPICSCIKGFEPKHSKEWQRRIWTGGCVRRKELACGKNSIATSKGKKDRFLRLPFMKVPDFPKQGPSRPIDECKSLCLKNCSCIAYAHDMNLGCMFWSKDLIDMQQFSNAGVDLYVRLAYSELDENKDKKLVVVIIPVAAGSVAIFISIIIFWWCLIGRRKGARGQVETKLYEAEIGDSDEVNLEVLPLFTFKTLANATDQFNEDDMLGKGGFGCVYKGKLANGKEIAVKRLSKTSGQGMEQFINEVSVISKLQHRNLVRLLGCCVEKEEKILVYEYMPNKSLDVSLFGPSHLSQKILDWKKRFKIIEGIVLGLLYLHRDSILKIIHRDLKPNNVLLDKDWNPKISDFGMARIFGVNQDHANTSRLVGTYGYMAPEYAMEGRFSEKSDVYSLGVLMLEILSGKKNADVYNNKEQSVSLLKCAWKLWNEDNGSAFIDQTIFKPEFEKEMVKCIHIALLCTQKFPQDRPAISTVCAMLSKDIVNLPLPKKPVFAEEWNCSHVASSQIGVSINDHTLTMLDGR